MSTSVETQASLARPTAVAAATTDETIRLIVTGEDRPGIVAAVSSVLQRFDANIVSLDQHSTDHEGGRFFQRTEFHLADFRAVRPAIEAELSSVLSEGLGLEWRLSPS